MEDIQDSSAKELCCADQVIYGCHTVGNKVNKTVSRPSTSAFEYAVSDVPLP
ncbi:Hypothetical predicted protein [Paramuricea clavata]|uniref:Uncharacterized protein n=1 Tax=Paramuricea clavata TaxID=317549 RepID=A0A7D9DI37_PARCT|nr:Hypothetical predicted protein [Paramuricea clavata]